jgi:hypothetical protein
MEYMLVKHRVADFARWRKVFDSHASAQDESETRFVAKQ